MKNLSYMEISKKVFLIFSAVLMLSIAIRWHTNTQITVNEDLAIEEYELLKQIIQKHYYRKFTQFLVQVLLTRLKIISVRNFITMTILQRAG